MSTAAPHRKTLWEEGRRPGRLVVVLAALIVVVVVLLDLRVFDALTVFFDISFVLVCTAAALAVRPRDFFLIGVLPPLLMGLIIAVLAVLARDAVADPGDGFLQTVVSGLAHHAGALVTGYALTLAVLALRQVALRNAGTIRALGRSREASGNRPRQRSERRPARATGRPSGQTTGQASGNASRGSSEHQPADRPDPAPGGRTDSGVGTAHAYDPTAVDTAGERPEARSSH